MVMLIVMIMYMIPGNTALHYAACGGYADVASELIAAGGHVEDTNENGHTPLMEAATAGHVDVAALLLASGASINMHSTEFKESALTLACYKGIYYCLTCNNYLSLSVVSHTSQYDG